MNKKLLSVIGIGIILILSIAISVIFLLQDKNDSQNEITQNILVNNNTDNNFDDWDVYENEKYGYEIKYPINWSKLDLESTPEKYLTLSNKEKEERSAWVSITVIEDVDLTVDAWKKSKLSYGEGEIFDATIFGKNGAVYKSNPSTQAPGNLMKYIVKDNVGYEFNILFSNDNDIMLGEKIISTFRFID
jgi:hypothetical protein